MKVIILTDQLIQTKETFIVGGWIQSFINILEKTGKIQLAVAGLTSGSTCIEKEECTIYYKVNKKTYSSGFKRIYHRWRVTNQDQRVINDYINAIHDFKPDIIHIFGTENFLCNVIPYTEAKVIVHIQGLINPYLNVWFPPGISRMLLNLYSFNLFPFLKGMGLDHQYRYFKSLARRELQYFKNIRYVMGRTNWDKEMTQILGENIKYFHLEEVLRPDFYTELKWEYQRRKKARLVSILSPSTYKGFDTILKTAHLLKTKKIDFDWIICGTSQKDYVIKAMEKLLKKKYSDNNVVFLGKKTSREIVSLLLDSDIYIHPSYIENSPNSICEAQILGIPVIATYTGGIPSLIEDNTTGILFPTNDIYSMANKIIFLLSNPKEMKYLGENARETALKRHNKNEILKNVENIYYKILHL